VSVAGRPELLIVADDLTGALDCACEAAARGIAAAVFASPEGLRRAQAGPLPPVVAVSTASRDGDAQAAVRAVARVVACLPVLAPARVMKKVDSRLKGHPGVETRALLQGVGLVRVLAAPAIPDMGRFQCGGGVSGAGVSGRLDIAGCLPGLDCAVPDITTPGDFDTALASAGPDVLPLGARGLAAALIARIWPASTALITAPPPAPALFVIGSRDPVTLAQIARLRDVMAVDYHVAPDGALASPGPQTRPLRLIRMTGGAEPSDPAAAAARLARNVASILETAPVATLFTSGGETAQALLRALQTDRIDVTGALLPGVALGQIAPPGRAPLHLVTKSGGFGDTETLAALARLIAASGKLRSDTPLRQENGNTS